MMKIVEKDGQQRIAIRDKVHTAKRRTRSCIPWNRRDRVFLRIGVCLLCMLHTVYTVHDVRLTAYIFRYDFHNSNVTRARRTNICLDNPL